MNIDSKRTVVHDYFVTIHEEEIDDFLEELDELLGLVKHAIGYGVVRKFRTSLKMERSQDLRGPESSVGFGGVKI